MKALLICPGERPAVESLTHSMPLANQLAMGKPLVVHWLEYLMTQGAKEVRILATDRPEQVRAVAGDGSRWGLKVEVTPETRELTCAEVRKKYCKADTSEWLPGILDVTLMDHFPQLAEYPIFESYEGWYKAVQALLTRFARENKVGAREIKPGVWVGLRTRIAAGVDLRAPCWIGANTTIGRESVVGPNAVVEDRSVVEANVEIIDTVIGAETFVGELLELKDSLANGSQLTNWRTSSCTNVPDAFLMCSLADRRRRRASSHWFGRCVAFLIMILTAPFAALPILKAKLRNESSLRSFVAVRPRLSDAPVSGETLVYYELAESKGWLRFWPQLWNIVKGDFAWVGNRPLSPLEVKELSNDFEKLWLDAPIGLISLAQAEGVLSHLSDEARACSSFYAVMSDWRMDISIIVKTLLSGHKPPVAAL